MVDGAQGLTLLEGMGSLFDTVQGNIGTTLSGSWLTGRELEADEDDEIIYVNNTLAAGLYSSVESDRAEKAVGSEVL